MKNILLFLPFLTLFCCSDNRSTTPKEYQYKLSEIANAKYRSDTTAILSALSKMSANDTKPFDLKTYDEDTHLFIDSVVYSPDQCRMIVFVIAKNSTTKLSQRENGLPYYYNGFYLYCSREAVTGQVMVYDYSGYRLRFFYNYSEISEALRDYCFNRLMRSKGEEQHYNVDDLRFWDSMDFNWVLKNSIATSQ